MDVDTAVVSDRKGSIAILSCSDRLEGKGYHFLDLGNIFLYDSAWGSGNSVLWVFKCCPREFSLPLDKNELDVMSFFLAHHIRVTRLCYLFFRRLSSEDTFFT